MQKTIFRQLLDFASYITLRSIKKKYEKKTGQEKLSAWEQFVSMSFAQLTHSSGLREIESGFESISHKSHQLGIRNKISKSSLSRANNTRPSIIFQEFAYTLIEQAKKYYEQEFFFEELDAVVYALDSTFISLCLSICKWGQIGNQEKAGVKVHTLLDVNTAIPTFIRVTKGSAPDCHALDDITIEPGAFYVMDKAYVDFKRLNKVDEQKGFFIVRAKRNIKFERVYSKFSNRTKGIIADQIVNLIGGIGKKNYHNKIRKIIFHDDEKNRTLIFMTNNFSAEPQTIALLYKYRWKIEIFFRWIKQNLQIKKFYGTSLNAIETQIWISISTYLLVMIAKKRLQLEKSMQQILHILSFSMMETIELFQAVNNCDKKKITKNEFLQFNQLNLFEK